MNDLIEARYYDNLLNDYLDTSEGEQVEMKCISELELNDLFECEDLIPHLSHNRILNDFTLEIEMEVKGEPTRIYEGDYHPEYIANFANFCRKFLDSYDKSIEIQKAINDEKVWTA